MAVSILNRGTLGRAASGGRRVRRLLVPLLIVVAVATAIIGVRLGLTHQAVQAPAGPAHSTVTSAQVEANWGIRVTQVAVLADGGLVELRYIVIDSAKAERLHSGGVEALPVLEVVGTGHKVTSNSLMFTLHHGNTDSQGTSYSIVYGNASGAIGPHSIVDVVFKDGSRLGQVPVS